MSVSPTVSEIFIVKEWRDLETEGRGLSMSLKMAPFDRSYTTLLYRFLSYLTLNNIVTLKSWLDVTQDHSNWYHSKAWVRFPIRLSW